MSPRVAPGRAASMPISSARRATSTTLRAFTPGLPTKKVLLVSPCQPLMMLVTSTLTMSPSFSFFLPGMPWQTTWLTEVQTDFGNP